MTQRSLSQAVVFGAIAGYADAIGYLRFQAFAGMMTGNTVFFGLAFFNRAQLSALEYGLILVLFALAAGLASGVLRKRHAAMLVLAFEAAMLVLTDMTHASWAVVPLVIAMGVQNPLAYYAGVTIATTFVTGNVVRFAESVVRRIWPHEGAPPAPFHVDAGLVWLGYVAGAALGALGFAHLSRPMLVPLVGLGYIGWKMRLNRIN